ncbi:uncharacterized protein LDX57_011811 [Aspergillus melleus]|uniref:uncharacterized protein n=1 Tax=Aspergillus melleus TaxID=138277 RepID=UPI001E8DEE6C|nr:uncharacterized protein LDX57_011811 [Aspergillus melleus]KAH8434173.1 hypothetical protein LDX57_011811 [Aspergillus melleus]
MSFTPTIQRDGFISSFGRFRTSRGHIERVDSTTLQSMFLPKLSATGQKALRDHRDFVRGQLQHYGEVFDESQLTGNGTQLIKKVLQAGGCHTVPSHIRDLEMQMHRDWLNALTEEEISHYPLWIVEKHFGSETRPDRTITTEVVGISFPRSSEYRVSQVQEAAGKVTGLHHEMAKGSVKKTVYLGWNKAAVQKAAKGHAAKEKKDAAKEKKELQAAEREREKERAKLHADYCRPAKKGASPVGSYIVDCKEIEQQWDLTEDMGLEIHATDEPGVFKAEFDFGVLEGVMIIGVDKVALERHCAQEDESSEYGDEWDEESSEEDVEQDAKSKAGSKRKTTAPNRGHGSKKSKNTPARKYFLKMRGRETGEGEIMDISDKGTISFKDGKFTSFVGEADMSVVGRGVTFTARKVSDTPNSDGREWADYSDRQYERERVGRWH